MRKWSIVVTTGLMTFCVTFASSVFSTTFFATGQQFGVSSGVMILGLSLYVAGFAFGNLSPVMNYMHCIYFADISRTAPLSEIYGRTRPLFIGMMAFSIFQVPVAVAQNLQTVFICRFLGGVFGSAPVAILGGVYVDFMDPIALGIAAAVFAGAAFAGPAAGPIIGSFVTQSYLGWRWTAWITLIFSVFFSMFAWIVTPETFEPVLLKRKAERMRHETKDWALHSESEEYRIDFKVLINKYLSKPLHMLVLEPIVRSLHIALYV
jgi:DHA1 family multidrug resistance protein-like MFS transporter